MPILAKAIRFELDVSVVVHEDMRPTGRMRAPFDHLAAELPAFLRFRCTRPRAFRGRASTVHSY